jgi:hypothetical protein
MTQPSIQDVDAAVRLVLLGRHGGAKSLREEANVFAERLFSLRHAEALPRGTREVRTAPGTVITPLARDFLKRQGIELRLVSRADVDKVRNRGEWGFAVEVESGMVEALRRALLQDASPWIEVGSTAGAAVDWLTEGPGRGVLLVTEEASLAVWRSCRLAGVRAASAHDVDAVSRAVRKLGVNLLVVEPAGKSISLLKQMGLTFRRGGAPAIPEGLGAEEWR